MMMMMMMIPGYSLHHKSSNPIAIPYADIAPHQPP